MPPRSLDPKTSAVILLLVRRTRSNRSPHAVEAPNVRGHAPARGIGGTDEEFEESPVSHVVRPCQPSFGPPVPA
jgi:hypothetical protein